MKTLTRSFSHWSAAVLAGLALMIPWEVSADDSAVTQPDVVVGGKAPSLKSGRWIQGEPVKDFDQGKCYLVEFWATWCAPCRATIPHLNEIHQKFKDEGLVVIGQNVWERDESKVGPFVKSMGEKMTYRVALDDKPGDDGSMAQGWMAAALANGIPTGFLVDGQGKIAWIGHPMELNEPLIQSVLSGKHDLAKAATDYRKAHESSWALDKANLELAKAIKAENWVEAERRLDTLAKLTPEDNRVGLEMTRARIAFQRGDDAGGCRILGKLAEAKADDAMLQNAIAWGLLVDPSIKKRDLDLAEKIAARGVKVSEGKSASILDTHARALFMNGKKDDAVKVQEQAVKVAGAEDDQSALEATLSSYRKGELPPVEH